MFAVPTNVQQSMQRLRDAATQPLDEIYRDIVTAGYGSAGEARGADLALVADWALKMQQPLSWDWFKQAGWRVHTKWPHPDVQHAELRWLFWVDRYGVQGHVAVFPDSLSSSTARAGGWVVRFAMTQMSEYSKEPPGEVQPPGRIFTVGEAMMLMGFRDPRV